MPIDIGICDLYFDYHLAWYNISRRLDIGDAWFRQGKCVTGPQAEAPQPPKKGGKQTNAEPEMVAA